MTLSTADRLEILDVIARADWAATRRDADAYVQLFTEDAVLDGDQGHHSGPAERPQAISLGAVNQNLARAVGPAIGGLILAATNAGTVFLANAVTFLAVIAVIAAWHSTRAPDALPREHVGEAVRAGGRYVAASPVLRAILIRAGLFIFFASAIWALLPLTARSALLGRCPILRAMLTP